MNKGLRPSYLTEADYPWLGRLIDEAARYVGRRRRELAGRFAEPLPFEVPRQKLAAATTQLMHLMPSCPIRRPAPISLRSTVFRAAAQAYLSPQASGPDFGTLAYRAAILETVAAGLCDRHSLSGPVIQERLYDDIPRERLIDALPEGLSPASLAVTTNGIIVSTHLKRAHHASIELYGETRRVVRQATLRGLLCIATRTSSGNLLEVSGPLSVIRETKYYGRAMAELVPFLAWCPRFELVATCLGSREPYRLLVRSRDPLPPAPAKPAFDSQLEGHFTRAFSKATDAWDLIREPEAVAVPSANGGTRLIFPDFAATRRFDPADRWLIEVIGFWTPKYLVAKLEGLQAVPADRLVLCIDERLDVPVGAIAKGAKIIRFKRRVDAREVLAAIEGRGS